MITSIERYTVRVSAIRQETQDIRSFKLVDPDGSDLPPFEAGAHVNVYMAGGLSRQYSLYGDPGDRSVYRIAVLHEADGRGGSAWMHQRVGEGDVIEISQPVNHFPLARKAVKHHLMLAGGIGVTPMVAMIHELERRQQSYTLHYCTRTRESTAFGGWLADLAVHGEVHLHHDGGDPSKGLNIAATIGAYTVGTHLYACGPSGFMAAVNAAATLWPPHVVHQEYFSARELTDEERAWDAKPFSVVLGRSGKTVDVAAGESIVAALARRGVPVKTDCEDGYCGTCITRFLDGEPVHRDSVLDESDRARYVMICCARSRSDQLVLDL